MELKYILKNSKQPSVLLGKGKVLDCNSVFSRLINQNIGDIVGRKLNVFAPKLQPDGITSAQKMHQILEMSGISTFYFKVDSKLIKVKINTIHDPVNNQSLLFLDDLQPEERKEDELQSFKSLVETSEDTIMRFDRDHRHLYVNKKATEMTGIPVKKFIGKTHEELGFPKDLCQLWKKAIDKVFRTSEVNRIEFSLPNNLYIDWYLVPELDTKGKVKSVITTARDISLRKEMETKWLTNSRKLQDAMRTAKMSSWELDFHTDEFMLDKEFCDYLGLEFPGETGITGVEYFDKYIHEPDKKAFMKIYDEARKSQDKNYTRLFEYRLNIEGKLINVSGTIGLIFTDGYKKPSKGYGSVQDISHFKEVEQELALYKLELEKLIEERTDERERLNSIIEATSDIVIIYTYETKKILYMNQAAQKFYGIKNKAAGFMLPLSKIQSKRSKKIMKSEAWPAAEKQGIWTGENRLRRKDGVEIPVSQVVIAHRDLKEKIECFSTIIRDLSAQKRTENELMYKNDELDTFVYRVSHDLRGPITSLMGLYQLVQVDIKDKPALKYFGMFNDQIIRLNETILALLDLTRIKESEAEKKRINFKKIVDESIEALKQLPNFSIIKFRKDIKNLPSFRNDYSLVTTIIQNLIENGIKYTKPQNPKAYVYISVKPIKSKQAIRIVVSDNGIGIPESIRGKVFNMFYRGNDRAIGSGLGLYIVKNAVEKLRGKISMDSVVDEGTTFTVELPTG